MELLGFLFSVFTLSIIWILSLACRRRCHFLFSWNMQQSLPKQISFSKSFDLLDKFFIHNFFIIWFITLLSRSVPGLQTSLSLLIAISFCNRDTLGMIYLTKLQKISTKGSYLSHSISREQIFLELKKISTKMSYSFTIFIIRDIKCVESFGNSVFMHGMVLDLML